MSEDFNFVMGSTAKDKEKMGKGTATSGSPEVTTSEILVEAKELTKNKEEEAVKSLKEKKIATSGSPNVITAKIRAEARKLAGSSKGLDIAAFQRKHHIYVMNVDELLKG